MVTWRHATLLSNIVMAHHTSSTSAIPERGYSLHQSAPHVLKLETRLLNQSSDGNVDYFWQELIARAPLVIRADRG